MTECIRCGRGVHEPTDALARVMVPPPCCDGCDRIVWHCFCVPVIPPAYTEHIGHQLMAHLMAAAA